MGARGRTTIRTFEIDNEIIERLSSGEPLAQICRDDHMPSTSTVYVWRDEDDLFAGRFARAREDGFDAIAMDALHIADESGQDTVYTESGERPNTEWISRSKLRVETRLKLLAKWDPKRYGDATMVKHADADGNTLPEVDDTTRVTRLAALAAALRERTDVAD